MRRKCTLSIWLAVVVAMIWLSIPASAKVVQREIPDSVLIIEVIDPYTSLPAKVLGPDGKLVEASSDMIPRGATIILNPSVALGKGDLDYVEFMLDLVVLERRKKPPFRYELDPGKLAKIMGSKVKDPLAPGIWHTAQVTVVRKDKKFTPAVETFTIDEHNLAWWQGRTQTPVETRVERRTEPVKRIFCPYFGDKKARAGDQLDIYMGHDIVGHLEVQTLEEDGFMAVLIDGEAPNGAEIYPSGEKPLDEEER